MKDGLDANLNAGLIDCLTESHFYVPIVFKNIGYAPGDGDAGKYYQFQPDVYDLFLNEDGYPTKRGTLLFRHMYRREELLLFSTHQVRDIVKSNAQTIFDEAN